MTKGYQAIQHWIAKVRIYLLGESKWSPSSSTHKYMFMFYML